MTDSGRVFDLHIELFDRQITDRDGHMAGKVDDVELETSDEGHMYVAALLVGPIALGPRLGARLGRWVSTLAKHAAGDANREPFRVPMSHVTDIGSAITVDLPAEELGLAAGERWIAERIIGRLPGASHASE